MLRARLARRIVVPLVVSVAVVFGLLAWTATAMAERRVAQELDAAADRVAATVSGLAPAALRPEVLRALAGVVGHNLSYDGFATAPKANQVVRERRIGAAGRPLRLLVDPAHVARRRRDVLVPIAIAGAVGLGFALLFGLLVAARVVRPIKQLRDAAQEFAGGTFAGDVGPTGPGEIGDLQESFVSMVDAVQAGEQQRRRDERFTALGRLAGGIAHELRNPLTAIRMAVEGALGNDDEGRAEGRTIALREIDRLERTLREMLDYVRPRAPQRTDVAMAPLFDEVVALLAPQCAHLGVTLGQEVELGLVLHVDRDRIKQALLNLVLNGAQAQPRGGAVRMRAADTTLSVADDGAGIPDEVQASLLQPFVTTREAGIGLGLAVVKQVADEHGALLEIDSSASGTVVRLRFQRSVG